MDAGRPWGDHRCRIALVRDVCGRSTIFAAVATILAALCLMFTDGLSDAAVGEMLQTLTGILGYPICLMFMSMFWLCAALTVLTYLKYGESALTSILATAIGASIFLVAQGRKMAKWENTIDRRNCASLAGIAASRAKLGRFWYVDNTEDPVMDGTLVPQEALQMLMPNCGGHVLYQDNDITKVLTFQDHLLKLEKSGGRLSCDDSLKSVPADIRDARALDLIEMVECGTLIPVSGKNRFVLRKDNDLTWLSWLPKDQGPSTGMILEEATAQSQNDPPWASTKLAFA
eukprot:gnl/TRDRNA2_/TRDRNA2_208843_c0_seq1.p1 gnl/TRDRNA2_/TRDRNA2_208843_c0~~gnl/TRDRNA2_/TRDRNA2_208843_c0_seq1.p1  ORF type:complete len:287 (-),score=36.69 gnl/TRDRNA2_/TRDRNA2_208843_c0_seq1:31-891(-)